MRSRQEVREDVVNQATISHWGSTKGVEGSKMSLKALFLTTSKALTQMGEPWHDPDRLQELYHGDGLSTTQIGERFGISPNTVTYWMDKHGIERRSRADAVRERMESIHPTFTRQNGYLWAKCSKDDVGVAIHQLVEIANGADPERIFSGGEYEVHHINGHPIDNRPQNLVTLSSRAHEIAEAARHCSEEEIGEALSVAGVDI